MTLKPTRKRPWVFVFAILAGVIVVPVIALLAWFFYCMVVPRYTAKDFGDITLRYKLYLTLDENEDSGEYLTVFTKNGDATRMLAGYDWPHDARKNIYRLADSSIVVMGSPISPDFGIPEYYHILLNPLGFASSNAILPDEWVYLGAFDFAFDNHGERVLEFYTPDRQPECIEMFQEPDAKWASLPRATMRKERCH